MRLILASSSPRRRAILEMMNLPFETMDPEVDEVSAQTAPDALVMDLAKRKALYALRQVPGAHIIGADTIVRLDGAILGKPRDETDARRMLRLLSARTHEVYTGVALACADRLDVRFQRTAVTFAPLDEAEIAAYIRTGEPMDKAGAYAIQGIGGIFITGIDGCYDNVMGLPMRLLACMLRDAGARVL